MGSSSMASVCGGVLAFDGCGRAVDAGGPVGRGYQHWLFARITTKRGRLIAIKLLTDIPRMGRRVLRYGLARSRGLKRGITGFQLDLKLKGLSA